MRIGELAKATGVEVETIRYYEREGLLGAPLRTNAGYRDYGPAHLEALRFIRHCRGLDMSLAEVRELNALLLQPELPCNTVNALIDQHLQKVAEQMAALQALQEQLQALREACALDQAAADCGILRSLLSAAQGQSCACHPHEKKEKV